MIRYDTIRYDIIQYRYDIIRYDKLNGINRMEVTDEFLNNATIFGIKTFEMSRCIYLWFSILS